MVDERARIAVIWDMETGDPDDALTLLLLLGHPRVDLRAVTITPGTPDQVGMVRHIVYTLFERHDVRIGAYNLDHGKRCLSPWHTRAFGPTQDSRQAEHAPTLMLALANAQTTLITGAPLKNLGAALALGRAQDKALELGAWFAQGGFAGDNLVPPQDRLPKFEGMLTCATYNLNGAPDAARLALDAPEIPIKRLISKNVCHGVYYDAALHERVRSAAPGAQHLELMARVMDEYLMRHPQGKKFHDPLAACCALTPQLARWANATLYRDRGQWGALAAASDHTQIITGYDHEAFVQTLLERA